MVWTGWRSGSGIAQIISNAVKLLYDRTILNILLILIICVHLLLYWPRIFFEVFFFSQKQPLLPSGFYKISLSLHIFLLPLPLCHPNRTLFRIFPALLKA